MGGAKGDLIFVIFAVVAIGVVWVFTGGPERTKLDPGAFLRPPAPLGSGEAYGGIDFSSSRSVMLDLQRRQDARATGEPLDIPIISGLSDYEKKVTIRKSTAGVSKTSAEDEYITLTASRSNNEKISITGWRLESLISGEGFTIGGATEIYISGVINSEPAIKLAPGETAIISTGRSPIGASFKTNKCTGYLEQFQDFSPRLSRQCPRPNDEFDDFAVMPINDFTCDDIINRTNTCEMILGSLPIGTSNQCSNFISQNINYTGCIKNHRDDLDFFGKEWRVYLGRSEEIWRKKREVIKLIDTQGKIVDTYTY